MRQIEGANDPMNHPHDGMVDEVLQTGAVLELEIPAGPDHRILHLERKNW
jgi:hypothetical protein